MTMRANPNAHGTNIAVEGGFPSLSGAVEWLNSSPPTGYRDAPGNNDSCGSQTFVFHQLEKSSCIRRV
jgi:hypothetical protein